MHLHVKRARTALAVLFASLAFSASAPVPSSATSVNFGQAKKAIGAARAEARKTNWPVPTR